MKIIAGKTKKISFAFSDDKANYYVPDFSLLLGNFTKGVVKEPDGWLKKNMIWVIVVLVVLLLGGAYFFVRIRNNRKVGDQDNGFLRKRKKQEKHKNDKQGKIEKQVQQSKGHSDSPFGVLEENDGIEGNRGAVVSAADLNVSELLSKLNTLNAPILDKLKGLEESISGMKKQLTTSVKPEQISSKLESIGGAVNTIKTMVSNTDEKKRIEELTKKVSEQESSIQDLKRKLSTAKDTINDRDNTINTLNDGIEQFKKQLAIPGSEEVQGIEHFVSFARHLIDTITSAENRLVQEWILNTEINEKQREGYFIANEYANRPSKEVEKWMGILSTLKFKSVIIDPELVKYLKSVPAGDRASFITKQFVESVLSPLVSCSLVLFEQFRTGKEWGYKGTMSDFCASTINEIISLCKAEDIIVDYRKLYEKLSNYDTVEIEDTVPEPVSEWIDVTRKDIVLYVKNYSISSKLLNHTEKTSCVVVF